MTDVLIAGAGPAGALTAILLARAGWSVRLCDRARFPRRKLCGDTLNPGACRVLSEHLDCSTLFERSRPIHGMVVTGPTGVSVEGWYDESQFGRALLRHDLDHWLVAQAVAAGAVVEEQCTVHEAVLQNGRVTGARVAERDKPPRLHPARLVIGADGRRSRLAFSLGLARHPQSPRRWAIGAYCDNVEAVSALGEMHVRRGHYIGVAPMPDGSTNVCLVVPHHTGDERWADASRRLLSTLRDDRTLRSRFAHARVVDRPIVVGPMAVDVARPGVAGLLLAGDAAGFIDPMTGDGLSIALRGAVLTGRVANDVLLGFLAPDHAVDRLAAARRAAFRRKWYFNRALRQLVAAPVCVAAAGRAATVAPGLFRAMIRYAAT